MWGMPNKSLIRHPCFFFGKALPKGLQQKGFIFIYHIAVVKNSVVMLFLFDSHLQFACVDMLIFFKCIIIFLTFAYSRLLRNTASAQSPRFSEKQVMNDT